eukprot:1156043-Pelagomonas_calceolata.AAC.21
MMQLSPAPPPPSHSAPSLANTAAANLSTHTCGCAPGHAPPPHLTQLPPAHLAPSNPAFLTKTAAADLDIHMWLCTRPRTSSSSDAAASSASSSFSLSTGASDTRARVLWSPWTARRLNMLSGPSSSSSMGAVWPNPSCSALRV